MAGRPPKPIEQHLREGTYRKDRHGALIITAERGIASAPGHLNQVQRVVFAQLVAVLDPVIRETDAFLLERAAVAICRAREADEILERDGLVVVDDKGNTKAHPMIQASARETKTFADLMAQFGGSPSSRARLGINMVNLAKTASQRMAEEYGDEDVIDGEIVPDAGEEPKMLTDGDVGYDAYDEPS